MYRPDWHIYIHMNDYDGSSGHDKLMKKLKEKLYPSWNYNLDLENRGGGELYAYVNEQSLYDGQETVWDGDFPKKHSFTVNAVDENEEMSLTWKIEGGRCISYTDEEGHEKLEGYHYTETDGKAEDVLVDGKWRTIRFYARAGASPDGDGRYGDYICVVSRDYADDFIIRTAPGEGKFGGVYIHEGESRESVEAEYVDAYIKNGKEIWAGEAACTEEDLTDALEGIIQKCEDKKDGADAGSTLFRFRLEETKPLASVTIPDGETTVSGTAFWNCTSLGFVSIPASVRTIQDGAFEGCRSLREVHFGGTQAQWFILKGFERITEDVAVHCSDGNAQPITKNITEYVIPEGTTEIGESAFDGCTALASVSIPASVTEIGVSAFEGCTSLAEIHYGGSEEQWADVGKGKYWHEDAPATKVHCTDGDADINEKAKFETYNGVLTHYNGSDSSVSIPKGVTEIDESAFSDCTVLASISIPASVTEINRYAFKRCIALAEIHYAGTKKQWFMSGGFRAIPETVPVHCSDGDAVNPKTATEYVIPDGVTEIGYAAFEDCTSLVSVSIPGSVKEIGEKAFHGCKTLRSVSIPDGVKKIGDSAFDGCESLASVTIPGSVTKIGQCAFWGCMSLASVTIPEGVVVIDYAAFRGCTALTEILYEGSENQWNEVKKGKDWIEDVPAEEVHCTDGDAYLDRDEYDEDEDEDNEDEYDDED